MSEFEPFADGSLRSEEKKRKRFRLLMIVVIAVVGIVALMVGGHEIGRKVGWWGESDAVRRLRADPLAAEDLLGLRLERAEQSEPRGFMGKSGAIYVMHWFSIGGRSMSEVKNDVIRYAEVNGWVYDEASSTEEYWNGKKLDENGDMMRLRVEGKDYVFGGTSEILYLSIIYL